MHRWSERFTLRVLNRFWNHNNGEQKYNILRSNIIWCPIYEKYQVFGTALNLVTVNNLFYFRNSSLLENKWSKRLAKPNSKSATHKSPNKQGREFNLKNHPKLRHDQKLTDPIDSTQHQNHKNGGDQNLKKLGKNNCSCNNWRLPGEPRSLDNFFIK